MCNIVLARRGIEMQGCKMEEADSLEGVNTVRRRRDANKKNSIVPLLIKPTLSCCACLMSFKWSFDAEHLFP